MLKMEPLVTVVCTTYNHEKYLREALDSFLMQETKFPIEIIVHDDASTDDTPKIIKEYTEKYPDVIKPVLQKENQYSKGIKIISTFVAPRVKGRYIATCEGDDYWTDPYKLQKQFDFMENHQEYAMCFHTVAVVDTGRNFLGRYYRPEKSSSGQCTINEIVVGGALHLSSRVIRKRFFIKEKPEWIKHGRHGDYPYALYIAAEGRVYFMDEVMSSYRTGVENSVMSKLRKSKGKNEEIAYQINRIETLNMADEYYQYRFHEEIQKVNLTSEVTIALLTNNMSDEARRKYRDLIKERGLKRFIKLVLKIQTPGITNGLIKLKKRMQTRNSR